MKQSHLLSCLFIFCISLTAAQAQHHFQGLKGITAEYGISRKSDFYSLGYQSFLSDRFQFEITGTYRQGSFSDFIRIAPYRAAASYTLHQMILSETIDYTFAKLFNRLYINLGAGLTQAYGRAKASAIYPALDSALVENMDHIPEFDQTAIRPQNKISLGGHASILTELYLGRYLTLLFRYRYTYFLKSDIDKTLQQTSIGIRINL